MEHPFIDLFSGAGGLSTGFHLAGFEALCAIDADAKALRTYQHNYPSTKIICDDIRKVCPSSLRSCLDLRKEELTAIIGGPPCQGFSRNTPAIYRSLNDSRNQLYQIFLDFVQEFKPLYAVIENVPEILKAYEGIVKQEITEQFESLGYRVTSVLLNASNYGVPQTRARAFFIASLGNPVQLFSPTHSGDIRGDYRINDFCNQLNLLNSSLSPIVTVREAISDLPPLEAGQEYTSEIYPVESQSHYQKILRTRSTKLTNHIARTLSAIQMARARSLSEGQDARNLPPELAPKKHYSGAYGRLYWDKPARTITRWVFHPGSGRFFHPTQDRTITIREAARLHSFPDSFHFLGSYTDMSSQIGESVPPFLSKVIADSILQVHQPKMNDLAASAKLK